MFTAAQNPLRPQPGEERPCVVADFIRVCAVDARLHHRQRCGQGKVKHGGKGGVEAEQAHGAANEFTVKLRVAPRFCGGHSCCRGHGAKHVAEAINQAAFQVDGTQGRDVLVLRSGAFNRRLEKSSGLRRLLHVAAKEDEAGRTDEAQPRALGRIERGAAEADDKELADLVAQAQAAAQAEALPVRSSACSSSRRLSAWRGVSALMSVDSTRSTMRCERGVNMVSCRGCVASDATSAASS